MKVVNAHTLHLGCDFRSANGGCEYVERLLDVRLLFAPETDAEAAAIKQAQSAVGELATQIRELIASVLPSQILPTFRCDGYFEIRILAAARHSEQLHSLAATLQHGAAVVARLLPELERICHASHK